MKKKNHLIYESNNNIRKIMVDKYSRLGSQHHSHVFYILFISFYFTLWNNMNRTAFLCLCNIQQNIENKFAQQCTLQHTVYNHNPIPLTLLMVSQFMLNNLNHVAVLYTVLHKHSGAEIHRDLAAA